MQVVPSLQQRLNRDGRRKVAMSTVDHDAKTVESKMEKVRGYEGELCEHREGKGK